MKEAVRKFKETVEIKSTLLNRFRSHRYFTATILAGAVVLASCFHIWQRVKVYELVKDVAVLKNENKLLLDYLKKVNSSIATLSLASRIEQYATDTLGMKAISPENLYTLLGDGQSEADVDDLDKMMTAIKRVAEFIPIVTENELRADELQIIRMDSTRVMEGAE